MQQIIGLSNNSIIADFLAQQQVAPNRERHQDVEIQKLIKERNSGKLL